MLRYAPVLLVASLLAFLSTNVFTRNSNEAPTATTIHRFYGDEFPGMNDNTTQPGLGAAHVIVDLYRHYRRNLPITPFTTLLINHSNSSCGSIVGSIDNDCCRPNCAFDSFTIPEWVEFCSAGNDYNPLTGFALLYDPCGVVFTWLRQPCSALARKGTRIGNISLVNNTMTGWVMSGSWVLIPDVFDTCWSLQCSFFEERTTEECILFAKENIVRYTIKDFVNIVKFVWDE